MKFVVTRKICDETVHFENSAQAARSPLVAKLFGFPWIDSVFLGPNFVTITKQDWVEWEVLADPLSDLLKEHLESGEAVLNPVWTHSKPSSDSGLDAGSSDLEDSDIVTRIKSILDREIRPAVQMDGGDVAFSKFTDDGVVHLFMQGSCSGCPSALFTLKEGIETRLKAAIPEVREVVST